MAYCVQRRSLDGYVSATGMFRASFPWAKAAEEHDERLYLKSVPSTSHDEVAGNVWIPEEFGKLQMSYMHNSTKAIQRLNWLKTTASFPGSRLWSTTVLLQ